MSGVAIVTDSTADIPRDLAEARGLRVVPMTVTFGEESFISGVTLQPERFYELLDERDEIPMTSQPNPAWFEEAFGDAADVGADAVVAVHISSELSGTCDVARKAAERIELPVEVVDSRHAGASLALVVFAALRAAEDGASAGEVARHAERIAGETAIHFAVDDLAYLRRGGRLTGAQHLVGSVLRVKPVLTVNDGRVEPLEKVRTWSKAVQRLGELTGEAAGGAAADVIVTHGLSPERAAEVWEAVESNVEVRERLSTIIGPVVGSHLGPGAVGVAVSTAG